MYLQCTVSVHHPLPPVLGGQIAIGPLSQFCQGELEAFGRGGGLSSADERSSEDRDSCSGEEPLVVFA